MDKMDEPDLSNFSTSPSHRLPTVSASQALKDAAARNHGIPSNLPSLDDAFQSSATTAAASTPNTAGIPRGQVTEVCGPPGVGKTALAMQLAANTLRAGNRVVWIDTGAPLPGPRLREMLDGSSNFEADGPDNNKVPLSTASSSSTGKKEKEKGKSADDLAEKITYLSVHTLAHLLVLFLHPTPDFPPQGTSLVVIDNVSAPLTTAFPSRPTTAPVAAVGARPSDSGHRSRLQWSISRKWAVAGDLATAMARLAALKDVAVVVINQFATSVKGVNKAVLKPAIAGIAWEGAVQNQVLLWRDFRCGPSWSGEERENVRFAKVVRRMRGRNAKFAAGTGYSAVPFVIERAGLREIDPSMPISPQYVGPSTKVAQAEAQATPKPPVTTTSTINLLNPAPPKISPPTSTTSTVTKRKATEIADSEDEADAGEGAGEGGGNESSPSDYNDSDEAGPLTSEMVMKGQFYDDEYGYDEFDDPF